MKVFHIRLKKLIFYIGLTLVIGFLGSMLAGNITETYKLLIKPPLSPPGIVFPIVWTVLYILLGISAYIIDQNDGDTSSALKLYWAQIVANSLWNLFFWRFEWFTFAALWIVLLIVLTGILISKYAKINRTAVWFVIPYLIWLCFALYLNIGFAILN